MPRPRQPEAPSRPVDPLVSTLRAMRLERGLSQDAVATAIGAKQRALASWETGVNPVDLPTLRRWTEFFDTEVKLTGVVEDPADVVYARGWDDCAASMTAAGRRSVGA